MGKISTQRVQSTLEGMGVCINEPWHHMYPPQIDSLSTWDVGSIRENIDNAPVLFQDRRKSLPLIAERMEYSVCQKSFHKVSIKGKG
jgi:hypothetical protein